MDDFERQKKLTFVLQLLEDLRHLHGSNIHKCSCEICDKKSSLINSSIAKAIEEVSQVSLSLSSLSHPNHETRSQASQRQGYSVSSGNCNVDEKFCQEVEELSPPIVSEINENKITSICNNNLKIVSESQPLNRDKIKDNDVNHLHIPNSQASQSMLSSTQRDSGVHCENLLHSNSISPIRSVVDDVEQNEEIATHSPDLLIPPQTSRKMCSRRLDSESSQVDADGKRIPVVKEVRANDNILTQNNQAGESGINSKQFDLHFDLHTPAMRTTPSSVGIPSPTHVSPIYYNQFHTIHSSSSQHQQISPALTWVPAAFYPLSIKPNRKHQNVQNLSQNSDLVGLFPNPLPEKMELLYHLCTISPNFQDQNKALSQFCNKVEAQNDNDDESVVRLLSNMHVSTPLQDEKAGNSHLSSSENKKEKLSLEGDSINSSKKTIMTNVISDCIEDFCSDLASTPTTTVTMSGSKKSKNCGEYYCQSRKTVVRNRNVLLSDARLSSEEEHLVKGQGLSHEGNSNNSVVNSFSLSDNSVWRPWEVKDDIYRIISDSSIEEEDDQSQEDKSRDIEIQAGDVKGGLELEFDGERKEKGSNNESREEMRTKGKFQCKSSLVSENHVESSPCKKTRQSRNKNNRNCFSVSNHSDSSSDGSIHENDGLPYAVIKSPRKKLPDERNTSSTAESSSEESLLDSFDASISGESENSSSTSRKKLFGCETVSSTSNQADFETLAVSTRQENEVKHLKLDPPDRSDELVSIIDDNSKNSNDSLKRGKSSSPTNINCKENRDSMIDSFTFTETNLSGLRKEELKKLSLKDISNKSLSHICRDNLHSEQKQNMKIESELETKISSEISNNTQPKIIVTVVDHVENNEVFCQTEAEQLNNLKLLEKGSTESDRSLLEVLRIKKESYSFCDFPSAHDNSPNIKIGTDTELSKNKSRATMKTFPPKHKTRLVFVQSNERSSQNSQEKTAAVRNFPVMGTKSATNKFQSLQSVSNGRKDSLSIEDNVDKNSTSGNLIDEIDEVISTNHLTVEKHDNADIIKVTKFQKIGEMESKEQENISDSKRNDHELIGNKSVQNFQKLNSSSAVAPFWGALAVFHSSKCAKSVGREDENELSGASWSNERLFQGKTSSGGEIYPEKQLIERISQLRLDKNQSNFNRSLPVCKSKNALPNRSRSGEDDCRVDMESFEANQSFPRMADRQRPDALNGADPTVTEITVGTQNLALDSIHGPNQGETTPLTLKYKGLTPRNRRSVFGFSPPDVSPRSAPQEKEKHAHDDIMMESNPELGQGRRQQQQTLSVMSPPQTLDKLWPVFDVSECFPSHPMLEEVLFNCVTSCICVVDNRMQGKIISVNEAFQQLVGIHEKVLGQKLSRFIKVRSSPSEIAVSTPQPFMLSDGSLSLIHGKLVSCITDRGEEIPVSLWTVPAHCRLSDNDGDVKLTVCVIGLVLALPDGFYLTKSGQVTYDDQLKEEDLESYALVPCRGTSQTGLLVLDSDGHIVSWDTSFFDLFIGQCDFKEQDQLWKYLSEVMKFSDSEDTKSISSSSSHGDSMGKRSPSAAACVNQNSPASRNNLLSQFGGDVSFLKESVLRWGDIDENDAPCLMLPVHCFPEEEDNYSFVDEDNNENDSEEEGRLLEDRVRLSKRKGLKPKREEESFSKEAAVAESLRQSHNTLYKSGALPTTSTPCKSGGLGKLALDTSTQDEDVDDGDCVELVRGIYSAKFHVDDGQYVDVTFKLGSVQTVENRTFFCLWFSVQEDIGDSSSHENSRVDNDNDDKDDSNDEDEYNNDEDGLISDRRRGNNDKGDRTQQIKEGLFSKQTRLGQIQSEGMKEFKIANISLGQLITDQAGLNQSLNATVGEDTLDLEQAVLGTFSDNYRVLETLGQGSFGFVRRAFPLSQETNSVVVKFIKKSSMLEDSWQWQTSAADEHIPTEVAVLQTVNHNNIVKLLDVHQNDQFVQLVMEDFASLDLFDFIDQVSIDETLACHIFKQIAQAVNYLHSKSILHRDIKDENVIINSSFHCKLIDFGSAAYFLPPGQLFEKFRGTLEYCSPEVHLSQGYRGPELDAWALGVTLYTIVFRENPYTADHVPHQMGVDDLPDSITCELTRVLFGLLCCDPNKRFSVAKALACPWLTQNIDLSPYQWDDLFSSTSPDYNVEY